MTVDAGKKPRKIGVVFNLPGMKLPLVCVLSGFRVLHGRVISNVPNIQSQPFHHRVVVR